MNGADNEISLFELVGTLWRAKLLIVVLTLVGGIAAFAAGVLMTPIYRSQVLLAPVQQDQTSQLAGIGAQFGGLAAMAGINLGQLNAASSKDEAVAILKSRAFTEEFLKNEDLLSKLYARQWDAAAARWAVDDPRDIPTLADGYRLFDETVRTVSEDKLTGLLTLSVDWEDPDLAAQWAGMLVNRLNEQMRGRAIAEAEKSIAYLNQQLQETGSVEVRQAIYQVMEAQIKAIMLANVREEFSLRVLDPAAIPDRPVRPRRVLMIAIGLFFGGALGALVALLRSVNIAQLSRSAAA